MDVNRFDQLLINYANEVLQLQFANQVFPSFASETMID